MIAGIICPLCLRRTGDTDPNPTRGSGHQTLHLCPDAARAQCHSRGSRDSFIRSVGPHIRPLHSLLPLLWVREYRKSFHIRVNSGYWQNMTLHDIVMWCHGISNVFGPSSEMKWQVKLTLVILYWILPGHLTWGSGGRSGCLWLATTTCLYLREKGTAWTPGSGADYILV